MGHRQGGSGQQWHQAVRVSARVQGRMPWGPCQGEMLKWGQYKLGKTWCRDDTWKEETGRGGIKETSLVRKGEELVKGWWVLGFKGQTARKVEGGQRE